MTGPITVAQHLYSFIAVVCGAEELYEFALEAANTVNYYYPIMHATNIYGMLGTLLKFYLGWYIFFYQEQENLCAFMLTGTKQGLGALHFEEGFICNNQLPLRRK